jgi:hypothetical protein
MTVSEILPWHARYYNLEKNVTRVNTGIIAMNNSIVI